MKDLVIAEKVALVADVAMRASGTEADKMLMDIAEAGDEYALEVLKELPHYVKARMVRESDFTKPSFTGLLSDPQDIVDIMVADPSIWQNPTKDTEVIRELFEDISIMCTSLILSHDTDEWFEEIFQAISESADAIKYFSTVFFGCVEEVAKDEESLEHEEDEYIFSFSNSQTGDGEISQIYEKMQEFAPELERQIAVFAYGATSWDEDPNFLRYFYELQSLYQRANASAVADTEVASEMEDL